jgi:hypothetical protein
MLKIPHPVYWAILGVVVLGLSAWFVTGSKSFQSCIHQSNQADAHTADNASKNGSANVSISVGYWDCTGQFVIDDHDAITAIATALLTFVTAGLVWIGFQQFNTTRAQLRAYVLVEGASIVDGPTFPNVLVPVATGCVHSMVTIKNFGATPAFDVRHASYVTICRTGDESRLGVPGDMTTAALPLSAQEAPRTRIEIWNAL